MVLREIYTRSDSTRVYDHIILFPTVYIHQFLLLVVYVCVPVIFFLELSPVIESHHLLRKFITNAIHYLFPHLLAGTHRHNSVSLSHSIHHSGYICLLWLLGDEITFCIIWLVFIRYNTVWSGYHMIH